MIRKDKERNHRKGRLNGREKRKKKNNGKESEKNIKEWQLN